MLIDPYENFFSMRVRTSYEQQKKA